MIATETTNDFLILALTPVEKWQAAGKFEGGFKAAPVLVFLGITVLVVLVCVFILISYKSYTSKKPNINSQFFENAKKRGLSRSETWILYHIAKCADLKETESIFTLAGAFDLGASVMIEQVQSGPMKAEEVEQLKAEIPTLREKLGFKKRSNGAPAAKNGENIATRDIEAGQKLYLTRRVGMETHNIEGIVIRNSDQGIEVKLSAPVSNHEGHQWRVRNYTGRFVLEFDVTSIESEGEGDALILNHTDEVRSINRRRYHRVPVQLKAYMTAFPFEKQIIPQDDEDENGPIDLFESYPVLPEFTPVVVTELAGPGLRVETSMELSVNQRVALIFYLPSENNRPGQKRVIRVVEDIGEVRHIQQAEKGYLAAIELTGLNEKDVNELVRATNVAAVQSSEQQEQQADTQDSEDAEAVAVANTNKDE
ncbi:MAG: hypothetical protein JW804_06505 [Sedimentisphaerales bacterium]|nr:hypothetical protein [Sedimentisphaerales bacterium]